MYEVYELSIFLDDVSPLVWRRFLIPAQATLDDLHQVIQVVMGWDDARHHRFMTAGMRFARRSHGRFGQEIGHESTCRVGDVLVKPKQRMIYCYDSAQTGRWTVREQEHAAEWRHTITLVSVQASLSAIPRCVDGGKACPPEVFGGPAEYVRYLTLPADPATGRKLGMRAAGGVPADFDPDRFQPHAVNRRLVREWTPVPARAADEASPLATPALASATAVSYLRRLIPGR